MKMKLMFCLLCAISLALQRSFSEEIVLPMGTVEKVTSHAISLVQQATIEIYQQDAGGAKTYVSQSTTNIVFANKQSLDTWFNEALAWEASNTLQSVEGVDRTQAFVVSANACNPNYCLEFKQFTSTGSFNLIYTNGCYTLPSLSGFSMRLDDLTVYPIPMIEWAILETPTEKPVFDSRLNPQYKPSGGVHNGFRLLVMPTALIVGTNDIKLMVYRTNSSYQIFNKDGVQIPETPVIISKPVITNSVCTIHISGGDPGRQLKVEGSTDLATWDPLSFGYWVQYTGLDSGFTWSEPVTNDAYFFRVRKY